MPVAKPPTPSSAPPVGLIPSDPVAINSVLIAVRQAAQVLCDRATLLVMLQAHTGASRYAEFSDRTGLASRLVSSRLAQLTEDGLLVRIPYSIRPLRHAYHLTHMGTALFDVLALLATWEQAWPHPDGRSTCVHIEHMGCTAATARTSTTPTPTVTTVQLHCAACNAAINPRDIALRVNAKAMTAMPTKSISTRRTSQENAGATSSGAAQPLPQGLAVLGDKWSIEVLVCAFFGVHQFGDFGARIGIATNILTDRLVRLVELGLLKRTAEGDTYRKGLYLLTSKGRHFYGVLVAIQSWADEWIDHRVRSPVRLQHVLCKKTLSTALQCINCTQPLTHATAKLRLSTAKEAH
jgi:DNA-binding HxlR family transcriptional regulator